MMKADDHLFKQLKENVPGYSKSQKALARFILANYQKIAFTTIKQFAQLSGISEATIVRFTKYLGFKGYSAFQREIRRMVRSDLKGNERFKIAYEFRQPDATPLSNLINKEVENLCNLQEVFDPNEFKKGISAIKNAKEILVVGIRSTASLAYHFWFGLTKLGLKTMRVTAISTEIYDYINKMDRKSLVIIIGFPRYLRELQEILTFTKKRGIKTITLTDSHFSPFVGDLRLYAPVESASFVAFHCAPMVLINGILNELSLTDKEKTLNALNRFEKLAEDRKYFDKT
jgi:DNA-binding MurR/RpiR family transcriptional regulator